MPTINLEINIQAPKDEVWKVLYDQFGDVKNFNPLITGSHYSTGSTGEVGCERKCDMPGGKYVMEKITAATEGQHFDFEVKGDMPMIKKMNNSYSVEAVTDQRTLVKLKAGLKASPAFIGMLMKPMIKGMLKKMMIGLKYYLETGEAVDKDRIKEIVAQYNKLEANESLRSIDAGMTVA